MVQHFGGVNMRKGLFDLSSGGHIQTCLMHLRHELALHMGCNTLSYCRGDSLCCVFLKSVCQSTPLLLVAGSLMQALYFTPNGAYVDKAIGALPGLPVPVNYPQYSSMAMLPLEGPNYSTQV